MLITRLNQPVASAPISPRAAVFLARHRVFLRDAGAIITVHRYAGVGDGREVTGEADVLARVMDYLPNEIVGSVQ